MNEQGTFIAALLDSSRKAYAAGAVLRLQEAGAEAARFVETCGFNQLVEDAQMRLRNLSEALACGRPELFTLDVEWLGATHAAREFPPAVLRAVLTGLQAELEENLPADAAATVRTYLQAAIDRLDEPCAPPASLLEADGPHVDRARSFLLAVLEGEREQAASIALDAVENGTTYSELEHHVIGKAQAEVGRMWQAGEIGVAEEHLGSRIVEDVLARLRARTPGNGGTGLTVLTASVSGNLHDIGSRMVADHFEMEGWRSLFLGANTPAGDLVEAVADFEPDLVALSVGLASHVRAAADTIAALRARFPDQPILVGGRPFALVPDLWKDVGADGCAADAAAAVEVGARLVRKA